MPISRSDDDHSHALGAEPAADASTAESTDRQTTAKADRGYILDDQVGFILRQVSQRHSAIFAEMIGADLTPTQWAVIAKLNEVGPSSQNLLGRLTAMDVATIKGVVDRLARRGLIETGPDPEDGRRLVVSLSKTGRDTAQRIRANAFRISEQTLAPLSPAERKTLMELLRKLR
ncbi:MarR family winged helix-turn-helix transcriptional regulator [Microvirga massiliensis]|uniref:MarR family winged helix-turn-helix transcriptional regulator n=1 Tax=Microvirga massiliensis TaxID=1033741 RepID=UPI0009E387A4|nr:MarR family transcriptional regulator [Microvirga massiliensis]